MRNLKRTLCLALAAVMALGMMVIGASAVSYDDLTDKDQIVHEEAVATMNSLGLIVGRDDGRFDPTANITRAEMCKVITLALHGGTDPVLGTSSSTFWDTKGHWAETYIEYCASNGIISGRGDGSFDPNSNITGTEAAKMILVALGYKSDVFKFTGPEWAINVDTRANDTFAKLYDELGGLNSSAAINRDNAAQMLYNGVIKARMLQMTPSQSITTGEVTYQWNWVGTMLNLKFNASVYEGVIEANEYANLSGALQKEGQYLFRPNLKDDQGYTNASGVAVAFGAPMVVAGETTPDMLGKTYKVIIKETQKGGVYTTVFGEPTLSTRNNICTITTSKKDAKAVTDDMKKAGINDFASGNILFENFANEVAASAATIQSKAGNGVVIEIIDYDNDGQAEYVLVNKPYIGKVTSYNEKGNNGDGYITVADKSKTAPATSDDFITGEKFKDVVGVENLAKDDIISYVKMPNDKFYVTKLNTVTGTVTRTTGSAADGKDEVRLDTTTYKESALSGKFDDDAKTHLNDAVALGKDANLYLDSCGNVVYVTAPEGETKYLYIDELEVQGPITGIYAKVVLADGTTATVQVDTVTNDTGSAKTKYSGSTGNNPLMEQTGNAWKLTTAASAFFGEGKVYKYSVASSGKYDLTSLPTANAVNLAQNDSNELKKGDAGLTSFASTTANSNTIFVVKASGGNTWTVYNGIANVPSLNKIGAAGAKDDKGVAEIIFVSSSENAGTSKSIYILDKKVMAVRDGNKDVYAVKAIVDGVYVPELILDGKTDNSDVTTGLYSSNTIAVNGDKVTFSSLPTAVQPAAIAKAPSGNTVEGLVVGQSGTSEGTKTLTVDGNTKFLVISGSKESDVTEGSIDDINFDSENAESITPIVMTKKSNNGDGQYIAGYVYIIRK